MDSSLLTYANEYPDDFASDIIDMEYDQSIEPYYEIIQSSDLCVTKDGVTVVLEVGKISSLQINVKVYQQKGTSWSMLINKTFSKQALALEGEVNYNFQHNVEYKVIAEFYADNEYDVMERYYMV